MNTCYYARVGLHVYTGFKLKSEIRIEDNSNR